MNVNTELCKFINYRKYLPLIRQMHDTMSQGAFRE